jgi:hypothetical protein
MARAVVWLLLIGFVLALGGQALGIIDVPVLRLALSRIPFGVTEPALERTSEPSPSPSPAAKLAAPSPSPAPNGGCTAAAPRFVHGAATLKTALGERMGDPLECERVVDAAGNTEQRTTRGLAYYRARSNITVFTNGFDHWAIVASGLVHWTSDSVEPPPDAERVP